LKKRLQGRLPGRFAPSSWGVHVPFAEAGLPNNSDEMVSPLSEFRGGRAMERSGAKRSVAEWSFRRERRWASRAYLRITAVARAEAEITNDSKSKVATCNQLAT